MNKIYLAVICLALIGLAGCIHIGSGDVVGKITKFENDKDMIFYGEMTQIPAVTDGKYTDKSPFKFSLDKENRYDVNNQHLVTEIRACQVSESICKIHYERELIVFANRAKSNYIITNVTEIGKWGK